MICSDRMTIQDVRSQHPRVVANHIDTLTLEAQRMRREISELKAGRSGASQASKPAGGITEVKQDKHKIPVSKLPVKVMSCFLLWNNFKVKSQSKIFIQTNLMS